MDNFNLTKFLAEGQLNEGREGQFDVATTERIAQQVADAFTAEDNELDLKYVVSPDVSAHSFDLDVEAGPNTPGEDWKDENGFDISNYLGAYAGGSFYIRDGVVYNAAMRNAPVARVSPEGEVEMISAEDSRAAIGMEEGEEPKSNKMKKSELKEMIKAAMLAEMEVEETEVIEAEEEVADEIELEDTEEVDVEMDADMEGGSEVDGIDVKQDAEAELGGVKGDVQDNLEAALEAAKTLGDEKLVDQIGNSLTFFTRQHVVKEGDMIEDEAEMSLEETKDEEVKENLNESIEFPMWNKIK